MVTFLVENVPSLLHLIDATLHVPSIPGALGHRECQTSQIFLSSDHANIIGLVEDARIHEGQPLLYYDRQFCTFTPLEEGRK